MDYKQQPYGKAGKRRRNRRAAPPYPRGRINDNAPRATVGTNIQSGFTIQRMPFFGYKIRKTLPYYTFASVASGVSNAANAYVLSANGLFDPDITGTGGQPMSFDQGMTFFNHYTVHKCRARVTFQSDSATLRATVGLFVSGSSTVTTVVENLIENGDGAIQQLEFAGAFGSTATLTRTLDVGRFQSVDDVMDDPNMRGDSASNPTEQSYFHLVVYNLSSAATVQVSFQVLLEYDVTFHEPRKGSLS